MGLSWLRPPSPHLHHEKEILITLLQGKSRISKRIKDKRGWGSHSGDYSAAADYKILSADPQILGNPALWKAIWQVKSLPKVDFFIWTLTHNNLMIGDNLRRKGWEGPSRCPLCYSQEESDDYLLLTCPFAKEVWHLALSGWASVIQIPPDTPSLLRNWASLCPFSLKSKDKLKCWWLTLPKFILWKIWLERNAWILKNQSSNHTHVSIKSKALLGDWLSFLWSKSNSHSLSPS